MFTVKILLHSLYPFKNNNVTVQAKKTKTLFVILTISCTDEKNFFDRRAR